MTILSRIFLPFFQNILQYLKKMVRFFTEKGHCSTICAAMSFFFSIDAILFAPAILSQLSPRSGGECQEMRQRRLLLQ